MDEMKELIVNEKYEEALKKLLLLDGEYLLKTQCLYELNRHSELVAFFEQVSDKIENDYFEILGFYILSLIELNEFDKALNILNEELSMPYIQDNFEIVLNTLYDDVLAKKQVYLLESGVYDVRLSEEEISTVLKESDYDDQLAVLMKLDDYNIRKLLNDLEWYLQADKSPVLKTFVLETLVKQQISNVVIVNKNNYEYEFMPTANQLVFQDINYLKTRDLLTAHLEKQPSYLAMTLDVLDMLAYIIYPQVIDEDETNFYAALIEYYVISLNIDDLADDFNDFYQIEVQNVIDRVDYLIDLLESEEKYVNII